MISNFDPLLDFFFLWLEWNLSDFVLFLLIEKPITQGSILLILLSIDILTQRQRLISFTLSAHSKMNFNEDSKLTSKINIRF